MNGPTHQLTEDGRWLETPPAVVLDHRTAAAVERIHDALSALAPVMGAYHRDLVAAGIPEATASRLCVEFQVELTRAPGARSAGLRR